MRKEVKNLMQARAPIAIVAATALSAFAAATTAVAASAHAASSDPGGYTVSVVAAGPAGSTQPDDITLLGHELFVAFQNDVPPAGSGSESSTIAEYNRDGLLLSTWSVVGHCDGLTADPSNDRVIGTVNEDGNSSLFTIDPSAASGSQLTRYTYTPTTLPHGGGTDAVSLYNGRILISASAPETSSPSYPSSPSPGASIPGLHLSSPRQTTPATHPPRPCPTTSAFSTPTPAT